MMKKKLNFAKKNREKSPQSEYWKILIVDDDESVHTITKTVLSDFEFDSKGVIFISAFNGDEAKKILENEENISLILLDVVMEEDNAGLKLAQIIREELQNHTVRIVLRTGQPGYAPIRQVIDEYDINDYKEKTELTADKLYSTVISSLRNYRDLTLLERKNAIIEDNRLGLKEIINSSKKLFEQHHIDDFAQCIVSHLAGILHNKDHNAIYVSCGKSRNLGSCIVLGSSKKLLLDDKINLIPKEIFESGKSQFIGDSFFGYFESHLGNINILKITVESGFSENEKDLLEILSSNISIAFENIYLDNEIVETQKDVINTLGEVVESRSNETANHVKRVAEYSYLLGKKYGLSDEEAESIKTASPLHDVGKIGIRDSILLKPAKLTPSEYEEMKNHARIGYEILKTSNKHVMKTASVIALGHHEKYDGTGYPNGFKGDEIALEARIVAIADVFDALSQKRCYKDAWSFEESVETLKEQKGKHFDPHLVDLFLEDLDLLKEIIDRYK